MTESNEHRHRSGRGNTTPDHCGGAKKRRDYSFTAFIKPSYDERQMRYFIIGEEVCPTTQRLHYQGYVYFYNPKTFKQCIDYFGKKKIHIEVSKGDPKENRAYCSKDDKYEEYGEIPSQGRRVDLEQIATEIAEGKKVDDIALENPEIYHQYGRTLSKLEDLRLRKNYRTEMTEGVWYWGRTGVGKSHKAFEGFTPETHYVVRTDDKGWWDGYTQQETVIINDFRGHIPYDSLLRLIDKWPEYVPRRGREPMPFTSKRVIITSSLKPEDVYNRRNDNDCIEQLLRRITVIELI